MQRESKRRWDATHITNVTIRLHNDKDADVISRLAEQPQPGGKQGYIKRLIREDIVKLPPEPHTISPDLP